MTPQPRRRMPWRQLFANREFRLIFSAQLVSSFGDVIHGLALMWLVYGTTGSALKTGGVATVLAIAKLLVGLPAGALVDRWNRKTVMVVSDIVRGITVASLVMILLITKSVPLWYVYGATFILGMSGMVFGPARNAVMPDIVGPELLLAANAAANMVGQLLMVSYAAMAGVVIGWFGPTWALAIDGMTFAISALMVLAAKIPDTRQLDERKPLSLATLGSDIKEGIAFMRSTALLSLIISVVILVNFGSGLFSALTPILVKEGLSSGPIVFGFISTAMLTGSILGTIALELLARRGNPTALVVGGLSGAGLSAILLGFVHQAPLALALFALMSFSLVFNQMPLYTAMQRATPGHLRGRVFNTFGVLANLSIPIAIAIGAWLSDSVGYAVTYISGGAIIVLGAAIMLQRGDLLSILKPKTEERASEMPASLASARD